MGSHSILPVIEPVDRTVLAAELNRDRFIRKTNKGNKITVA